MSLETSGTFSRNGITFYTKPGQTIEDYKDRQMSIWTLKHSYNAMQQTLICCECDWSFTLSIISNRGSGLNLTSTTLNSRQEWFAKLKYNTENAGNHVYKTYIETLKICESQFSKCVFGINAKKLDSLRSLWNPTNILKFDRILCTFPRVYDRKWSKRRYNNENEALMFELLKSYKEYLSESGEAQFLLYQDQFFHFGMNESLKELDLELKCWYKMNEEEMKYVYTGYVPRDTDGNIMNMKDAEGNSRIMYLCCFALKNQSDKNSKSCLPIACGSGYGVGQIMDTLMPTALGSIGLPFFSPLTPLDYSSLFIPDVPSLSSMSLPSMSDIENDETLNSEIFDSVCETLKNKYNVIIKQEIKHKNQNYVITNDTAESYENGWFNYTISPQMMNVHATGFKLAIKGEEKKSDSDSGSKR